MSAAASARRRGVLVVAICIRGDCRPKRVGTKAADRANPATRARLARGHASARECTLLFHPASRVTITTEMFDISQAWATIQRLANSFMAMLPRFILAVLLAWGFTFVGRLARRLVERGTAQRREHRTLQIALGRLVQAAIVVVGLLVAATASFPTFTMA